MLSLEALTAQARQAVAAKEKAAELKTKAKTARTSEARQEAESEALAIQATIDWRPVTLVFHQRKWECACGHTGLTPDGLFIHYEHTRMANSNRLMRPRHESEIPANLPKRVRIASEVVMMCVACSSTAGFLLPWVEPPRRQPSTPALRGEGEFLRDWRVKTNPEQENDHGNDEANDDSE